jgi:hypothetical protein
MPATCVSVWHCCGERSAIASNLAPVPSRNGIDEWVVDARMRVRLLGLVALAVAGESAACGKSRLNEPEIAWQVRVDPACRAAHERGRPLLFFYAASWDVATKQLERRIFSDAEVRAIVNRDYVPLRVDRTNTWMQEESAPPDELREVEEAVRRFKPYESKYATVLVTGPDCATELDRFDASSDPRAFAARLRSAQARVSRPT